MATNISGSVSLTYGTHTQSESFSTTASTLLYSHKSHEYSAGGAIALVGGTTALDVGTIDGAEGLLLIKNNNNYGALSVSMDTSAYDISIPAGVANLISVGPDHPVNVKCPTATITGKGITSASSAGAIVLDDAASVGTAWMVATTGDDDSGTYVIEFDTTTTGTVYELDGVTKKDLSVAGSSGYDSSTEVTLTYFVQYRYTLTEA